MDHGTAYENRLESTVANDVMGGFQFMVFFKNRFFNYHF